MHIATIHCEHSLLRLVALISFGEHWTLFERWGEKPGRKSAKRLFTYRSSDNSKTEEKWNKSGSLKARTKQPLPVRALFIHGTRGRKNKNKKEEIYMYIYISLLDARRKGRRDKKGRKKAFIKYHEIEISDE